ncbi:hypothetical protein OKT76_17460 [Providencia rettgeri]|uniref:hypothetical protein n=1 Tax=Providencia TaxID=586 RepID=UPI00226DEFCC|nr:MULTISPECIES: hypothetical protein [Providencia]MCX9097514.1 hypothetical protein [Providencia rettgeri]HCT9039551.1 hypothetical protein [Providencia rettgeri]
MDIQFKDFTIDGVIISNLKGVRRDRRLMNDKMNQWLNENNITDIINIESLEYEVPPTIGSLGGVKFHGFWLWYKIIK